MTADAQKLRALANDYTAAWCSMDPTAVAASFYEALPDMQVLLRDFVVNGDQI